MLFSNKNFNLKDTIVVAGAPRSGTTWLMELLGTIPEYTYIMEPLNPIWFPDSFEAGFRSRKYLRYNEEWLKGKEHLFKIFTGKQVGLVPEYEPSISMIMHRLLATKLIVKTVKMNRMLPWIAENFQLKHIFLIVRHPCAVVASQMKSGWCGYHSTSRPHNNIFPNLKIILDEARNINGISIETEEYIHNISTLEEVLALAWCLDYYVPFSDPKQSTWTTVFYEDLLQDGEKEIKKILENIGVKKLPATLKRRIRRPSMVSLNKIQKEKQLSKWKKELSKKQIDRILKIVSHFKLDFYSQNVYPNRNKLDIMQKKVFYS